MNVCIHVCMRVGLFWCVSGGTAEIPSATPLVEKISREPAAQASTRRDRQTQTTAADSQRVAFKLGGSEEADLDSSDMETKDTDVAGESFFLNFCPLNRVCFWIILHYQASRNFRSN